MALSKRVSSILPIACAWMVAFTAVLVATPSKDAISVTLVGEITDTLCAAHGSHAYMMEQMKSMGTDKVSCIQKCLQLGGKLALYVADKKTVYKIDNPDKVEQFEGRKVRISGEAHKNNLKVDEIEAAD